MGTLEEPCRQEGVVSGIPGLEAPAQESGLGEGAREVQELERVEPRQRALGGGKAARQFHRRRHGRHEEKERLYLGPSHFLRIRSLSPEATRSFTATRTWPRSAVSALRIPT